MKCTIPEISWHNREPVLSIDLHPIITDKFYRLATGGADCHVLIWQLNICDNGAVKVEALSDLTRHQKAVNSVRWDPMGQYLAAADDDANIIIWQLKTDNIPLLEGETNDKEVWIVHKIMRGHKEDIYDLCWSPDGTKLLTGSIDNTAILWDLQKGKSDQILGDHKGFVQGVSWDPKGHYLATISTDRVCRIFDKSGKHVKSRIHKGILPVPEDHYFHKKEVKFFHDDTFKSFFRRLDFSPDGSLLAAPSSHIETEDCKKTLNATLIFAVESWSAPVAVLPTGKQCSTVARFCPILFEHRSEGPEASVALPFRMILAVGTEHDVILYDTQQMAPFAYFRDIHYTRLTDLTWSKDGLLLIASSTDGFCALITFEPEELGVQWVKEDSDVEESFLNISGIEELEPEENANPKKPNILEKWTIKTPNKSETNVPKRKQEALVNILTPKRIKPIPVATETTNESQKAKSKHNSPLMSFLKTATKPQTKNPTTEAASVVVDEIEARDAWKCEQTTSPSVNRDVITFDDNSESFHLRIEESNTADLDTSKSENQKSEDKLTVREPETAPAVAPKVKKRVPLITLSSPKQKMK